MVVVVALVLIMLLLVLVLTIEVVVPPWWYQLEVDGIGDGTWLLGRW